MSVGSDPTAADMAASRAAASVGVRDADHLSELHRELDDPPGVREPFLLVRVEDGLGRLPAEDHAQLPGEVGGVADPGAQALSGERRHLVRSVAGQEDPS